MLAGDRIFVRVRFPVFILMCLSDAFVVKCDKISIEARIKETVRECLGEGILYEFLKKNGGDIMDFINIELTREECEAIRENDGYERGLQEGINKGSDQGKLREQQAIAKRMKSRDMDITEISDLKIKTVNAEAGKQSCGNGSGAPLFSTIKV